ncbi:hypothetical protein [Tessaracoccus aquimaris]|uniref:hypothetical protein n=1 Tax=Tessaracoccus aquimaris TaxID=1332264 RepID=UPI001D050260|nr:hypothetical protein [Tessaracoccus aquimaris]
MIVARYLAAGQAKVDELTAIAEEATRSLEEYFDEHAVEDGLLAEAMEDDKISKALVAARLRLAKRERTDQSEINALERAVKLYDGEAAAKKAVKEAQAELDQATLKAYGDLTEADVRSLVLDDKWRASLDRAVMSQVTGVAERLVRRLRELGARYEDDVETLKLLEADLDEKLRGHLASLGVS